MLYGMVKMKSARLLSTSLLLLAFLQSAYAFGHVPGSPCADLCSGNPQNTLANDVVCLDNDFFDSADGEAIHKCIACQLNSTAVDTAANQSDVEWALRMRTRDPDQLGLC